MNTHPSDVPPDRPSGNGVVPPLLRSNWPTWSGYAAAIWSVIFGLFGLWWSVGGAGFPFGQSDPRADEVGSLFGSAESGTMGIAIAGLGLLGGCIALLMARSPQTSPSALPLVYAWVMSAFLLLAVPDIRVVQNFAYLLFAYTGPWDWPLFFMLFCMLGGVLWAATAVSYHRRVRRACAHCGRRVSGTSLPAGRWGRWVTYVAVVLALPYPIVRIAWGLGIPLGVPADSLEGSSLSLRIGESALGGLFVGGAILTQGLTQRWGEVFPRWMPYLRGRRVPIRLAVVPAAWAAMVMAQAGLRIVLWTVTGEASISADTWGEGGPGLFWLPWSVALGAATNAYYLRRRGRCQHCGRDDSTPRPTNVTSGRPRLHGRRHEDNPAHRTRVQCRTTATSLTSAFAVVVERPAMRVTGLRRRCVQR